MPSRILKTSKDASEFARFIVGGMSLSMPVTVSWVEGEGRTPPQNRTIHKWFREIADQRGDVTAREVKAECNLTYGVPILRRDDEAWGAAFGYLFDSLNRPAKVKALMVLDVPVTRSMKVPQLCEYMDPMFREYTEMGFKLTDPEMQKYEAMA
jgi:hypothetical protein